jgi:hypothetical protein
MEAILFVLTFRRWYVMRKSHPDGVSIIHIFFRDGMIYFAIIFGAVSLLVREPGSLVLTSIGSHGRLVLTYVPLRYDKFGRLSLLVCPVRFILLLFGIHPFKVRATHLPLSVHAGSSYPFVQHTNAQQTQRPKPESNSTTTCSI